MLTHRFACRLISKIGLAAGLLVGLLGLGPVPEAQGNGCAEIYNPGNGWVIKTCPDSQVSAPMAVVLNGTSQGQAGRVVIQHKAQGYPGLPEVAVIYASGFIRLKPNADPSPPIPFGSSFILGPAYWPSSSIYYHNPQLTRLEINTSRLPTGPLQMQAAGTNHQFNVSYRLTLPPPRDRQTRLHVLQSYTAASAVTIDPVRRGEAQGFKLVQVSSMFINQAGACDGGQTNCHDSNAARFIGGDLARRQVNFSSLTAPSFIFSSPTPLGDTWLDALHTDNQGWQGNTPNVRIALDSLPGNRTITPQGYLTPTTNPNDDNLNLWLHDDGPASQSWMAGQAGQISYWLLAQDNPPEPWADLGLRRGLTFLDFEGSYNCFLVKEAGQPASGSVSSVAGYQNKAVQLSYDLGDDNSNWLQLRCNFNPPLNLSAYDHLRLDWRGDPASANSVEIGLVNPAGSQERIFARGYHHGTHHGWWGQLVIPFQFLHPWTGGTTFNPGQVNAFFVSVVKDPADDTGGAGRLAVDNLAAFNVAGRQVPTVFEPAKPNPAAATAAANWLLNQQQATGLLKSWPLESQCIAHVYDQALALLVFIREGKWSQADKLAAALAQAQNTNGSWSKSYNCSQASLPCIHCHEWEGDVAWAVYALSHYLISGGSQAGIVQARDQGAAWLATRLNPATGCLENSHTEGTIDAWWAFQAAGLRYVDEADAVKNCLLTAYWDESMGRFKGVTAEGEIWWQPYLDNQTWGAAFLKAIGQEEDARRALSYANQVLRLPARGSQLFGFDGNAGPWSVWNEGAGQYVAGGGPRANDLLLELLAQQQPDGAVPGSPDDFDGGGIWTTRWPGVAPTAWLYNALTGEPFHPYTHTFLPVILK